MRFRYTKGDCYALCEFLEYLTRQDRPRIRKIATELGYETKRMTELLEMLADDVDTIIATEQSHRDDTDQMAIIMKLTHIEGHDDGETV